VKTSAVSVSAGPFRSPARPALAQLRITTRAPKRLPIQGEGGDSQNLKIS
jgi:hypothetical protein